MFLYSVLLLVSGVWLVRAPLPPSLSAPRFLSLLSGADDARIKDSLSD
ncbi:sortase B protein-sorting domain-containing protein [Pseudomonas asiatica]